MKLPGRAILPAALPQGAVLIEAGPAGHGMGEPLRQALGAYLTTLERKIEACDYPAAPDLVRVLRARTWQASIPGSR